MTADPYGQWVGASMDDRDIEELLEESGWGLLSVAEADRPYSIPISFGYDGTDVYFVFVRTSPRNAKFEFLSDGKPARLLVTDIGSPADWQSVAVEGPVRSISQDDEDWATLLDVLDDNAWFSSQFRQSEESIGLHGWRLEVDEIDGMAVSPD